MTKQDIQKTREGIAAVELAVCMPVILILTLATLQACAMFYLKQTLAVAAYEGVREAVDYRATSAEVTSACNGILTDRKVTGGTVAVTSGFETLPRESWITVTVSAPCNPNAPLRGWFYENKTLSVSATMMKEY